MIATTAFQTAPNTIKYTMSNSQAGPSPPETYLYGKGAQSTTSPIAQTPPSNNVSPTNTHSHLNVRQLRQPRGPMYIPAALRPTDPPARPTDIPNRPKAPDTPPSSKDNSFDSVKANDASIANAALLTAGSFEQEENPDELRRHLSGTDFEGLELDLGDVTGAPTTAHWKPDAYANDCAVCHVPFKWYFRRHHCRHCGDLICDNHSTTVVPLDQNARYHPDGMMSKACDPCWFVWKKIQKLRQSRANSLIELRKSSLRAAGLVEPHPGLRQGTWAPARPIPCPSKPSDDAQVGSMAHSEGGMVWSTF